MIRRTKTTLCSLFLLSALALAVFSPCVVRSQEVRFERRFPNGKPDVDSAIQQLQGSFRGRIPILEGFVTSPSDPLDRFDRGYYECAAQTSLDASGGTVVRISAKITAWYADPGGALSGYRVLSSNGRIETDLLDQISAILAGKARAESPSPILKALPAPSPVSGSPTSAPASTLPARLAPPSPASPAPATSAAPASNEDLESLRRRREDAEKRAKSLESQVQDLEEILRNQSHPDNLVVVRKSGTPVLSQPGGTVLMTADANDEFELISVSRDWAHVQISGASRGWIERSRLDLPEGFAPSSQQEAAVATEGSPFHVSREETSAFSGDWLPLRGKSVRIIWAEPATDSKSAQTSSPEAMRKFAMAAFSGAYKARTAGDTTDGVVIVFDSADGGQIAATMSTLGQLNSGSLSQQAFWKECSIDPPDFLQNDQPKPAAGSQPRSSTAGTPPAAISKSRSPLGEQSH